MKFLQRSALALLAAALLCLCGAPGVAAQFEHYSNGSYTLQGYSIVYKVLYPPAFDPSKQYPVLFFLHGAPHRGRDNEAQIAVWGKDWVENSFYNNSQDPAIVVLPQCPWESYWSTAERMEQDGNMHFSYPDIDAASTAMISLQGLIGTFIKHSYVDKTRVYVGGLSMGGMGTLELLWRMPNTFAAAIAICGGGVRRRIVENIGNTSLRLFHGTADKTVPFNDSFSLYQDLTAAGKNVEINIYDGVGHDSWFNVFNDSTVAPWLLAQRQSSTVSKP